MVQKRILDGSSFETVVNSFAMLWNVEPSILLTAIQNTDIYAAWEDAELSSPHRNGDEAVISAIKNALAISSASNFDVMKWFHLSRVPNDTTFEEGILPTHQVIDRIWSFIQLTAEGILSIEEVNNLRSAHEAHGRMYQAKLKMPGPFALNLKEIALNPRVVGNHDYLATTEILDDIVEFQPQERKQALLSRFKEATIPCIVTFEHPVVRPPHVARAIFYLKEKIENDLSSNCNYCFDGYGQAIPREFITDVEFVDYKPQQYIPTIPDEEDEGDVTLDWKSIEKFMKELKEPDAI